MLKGTGGRDVSFCCRPDVFFDLEAAVLIDPRFVVYFSSLLAVENYFFPSCVI